jgi:hypothetical protein
MPSRGAGRVARCKEHRRDYGKETSKNVIFVHDILLLHLAPEEAAPRYNPLANHTTSCFASVENASLDYNFLITAV